MTDVRRPNSAIWRRLMYDEWPSSKKSRRILWGKERYMLAVAARQGAWASNQGTRTRGANQTLSRRVKPRLFLSLVTKCVCNVIKQYERNKSLARKGRCKLHMMNFRRVFAIHQKRNKYTYLMSSFLLFLLYSLRQDSIRSESLSRRHIGEYITLQSY